MTEELEDLEVLPATRSPHGYLASPLSDNIHMTDEGYLIVVGCPVARTGWQKYTVADLPQELAKKLGVDVSNPHATIDLYRPAKEVFHPEFLASLNGKPITDGHPPNGEFVDPKNFDKYSCGHIQNVRKGTEPLEDGEVPIIADLIISKHQLIEKVRNKVAREISLGYDFSIDRDGDKIIQCSMLGNHNAVVPSGRAGDFVRIDDAMPLELETTVEQVQEATALEVVPEIVAEIAFPPIAIPPIPTKEKHPVAETKKKDWLRLFKGKHLIELARATDADPEEVMDAAEALNEPAVEDKKPGKDGELPVALKENEFKSDDKKGKDEEVTMSADRKAAHDALDRAMDRKAKDGKATDSNVPALKTLLDEFLTEEEKEPEHADDVDPAELEAVLAGDAEDCPDCGKAHDSEECPGEEEVESGEEEVTDEEGESPDPDSDDDEEDDESTATDRKKAADSKRTTVRVTDAADGVRAVLRMLRPAVARANDKNVNAAFNRALGTLKTSRASTGSYGKFASSARARDKAPRNPNPERARAADGKQDQVSKMQAFYDKAHKGGK